MVFTEMPMSLEDDYFGTYSYNSSVDTNVWDPLNIQESDTVSNFSSSTDSFELYNQMNEEERASPELGIPHPIIFRKSTT